MMTIKHVHDSGEYLVEGSDIQFFDGNVHYTAPSGEIKELDRAPGTAYVMNQYGATVATYRVNHDRAPAKATFQSEVNSVHGASERQAAIREELGNFPVA